MKRLYPFPQIIEPIEKTWEFKEIPEETPSERITKRVFQLPCSGTDIAASQRNFEMAKLRFSPDPDKFKRRVKKEKLVSSLIKSVDRLRINQKLRDLDLLIDPGQEALEERIESLFTQHADGLPPWFWAIMAINAEKDSSIEKTIFSELELDETVTKAIHQAKDEIKLNPDFECVIKCSKDLAAVLKLPPNHEGIWETYGIIAGSALSGGNDPDEEDRGRWGKMYMENPPCTIQARPPGERKCTADFGPMVRRVDRIIIDQRFFVRKKITTFSDRGTILIDVSGSMELEASEIEEVVKKAPAVTIAMYCAPKDHIGELTIIAKNGKIADISEIEIGGGNVIDGPALEWLCTQTYPRFWISDGEVTGVGDTVCRNLSLQAKRIVALGHIRRIESVEDFLEKLRGTRSIRNLIGV